jgi:hypothetical protein
MGECFAGKRTVEYSRHGTVTCSAEYVEYCGSTKASGTSLQEPPTTDRSGFKQQAEHARVFSRQYSQGCAAFTLRKAGHARSSLERSSGSSSVRYASCARMNASERLCVAVDEPGPAVSGCVRFASRTNACCRQQHSCACRASNQPANMTEQASKPNETANVRGRVRPRAQIVSSRTAAAARSHRMRRVAQHALYAMSPLSRRPAPWVESPGLGNATATSRQ